MTLYFDHNSCTPVDPRVLDRFRQVESDCPGNPGSLHSEGRKARAVLEAAREDVAQCLRISHDQVLFVSGGTEANNLVVFGVGDVELPVLLAPVEHPSVLEAAEQRGVVSWGVDGHGAAQVEQPEEPVGLICLVHGQNEVGTLQPIRQAGELAAALSVPFHVDASQTLGRCTLDEVRDLATSITFSTHKAGGLRGMGVLATRGDRPRAQLFGGGQQQTTRPGTESPSLAAATALAFRLAFEEQPSRRKRMLDARAAFIAELENTSNVITPLDHSLPNTLMCWFDGIDGRVLLPALDMEGIQASQGSACSSGSPTPPAVLRAMGMNEHQARASVRFSFSHTTSVADAASGGALVRRVAARLARP